MAVIRKNSQDILLRELSGRVGGIIIKHCNGKTYISARPRKFNVSKSPESIARRERFRTTAKFASFINRIPMISAVWKELKNEKGISYCKICKYNFHKCDGNNLSIKNVITPPHHHYRIKDIVLYEDNFEIMMEDWFQPEENDKMILIMALLDPIEKGVDVFHLMDISANSLDDFKICLTNDQLRQCERYKRFIMYAAMIWQKENDIKWSNTFAMQGYLDTILNMNLQVV